MGLDVVFDSLCLDRCLRSGFHLDIVMLLLLGDVFLMVKFVSVRVWITGITHLTRDDLMTPDLLCSVTYSMPYWSIFPFQIWFYRSSRVCMLIPIHDIGVEMMVWSLFYDDPSVEPLRGHSARPTIHLMPHWGIFPFRRRFGNLHRVTWSFPLTEYVPRLRFVRYWYDDSSVEPLGSHPVRHALLGTQIPSCSFIR